MEVNEIPQHIIDHLQEKSGKFHSTGKEYDREGTVINVLAELLTMYDQWKEEMFNEQ